MSARRVPVLAAAVAALLLLLGVSAPRSAQADPKAKKDIEQKMTQAMENYDLLEYEEARKILNQALTIAKKAKIESDPITAKVHLRLGIVYFAGLQDRRERQAVVPERRRDRQVDRARQGLRDARRCRSSWPRPRPKRAAGGGGDEPAGGGDEPAGGGDEPAIDCASVTGVQHTIVEEAKGGKPVAMSAAVGADVQPAKMVVMYRPKGSTDFTEAKMALSGECVCTSGAIPATTRSSGDVVHYYVAAFNAGGQADRVQGLGRLAQHHRGDRRRRRRRWRHDRRREPAGRRRR
jgi:hypothetical protein